MPITLNHSNIGIQYNTGSNYIIETVKSDLYLRNEIVDTIVRDNIQTAPVTPIVSIQEGSNIYAVESYTYSGTANTADYTRVFPKNTVCDILVVGGGGAGGRRAGGGGGAGALLYHKNQILNGTYNIKVGKGGRGVFFSEAQAINNGRATGDTSGYNGEDSQFIKSDNTKEYLAKGGGGGIGGASGRGGSGGSAGGGSYSDAVTSPLLTSLNKFNNSIVNIISNSTYDNTGLTYPEGCYGRRGGIQVNNYKGGGGGGAGGAGMNHAEETTVNDGYGGLGLAIDITGTPVIYAGGGNGSDHLSNISQVFDPSYPTIQSRGGGGFGSDNGIPENGLDGTGGGGGGQGSDTQTSGAGGSGIVIIRYLVGTVPTNNLLTAEPTVISPVMTETVRTFVHSGGTEAQTTHTITVGQNTICDILIVGGGGGGGKTDAGGGGAGGLIYVQNIILTGTYDIKVGKGGLGGTSASTVAILGDKGGNTSFIGTNANYVAYGGGGGGYGHPSDVEPSNLGPYGSSGGLGTSDQTRESFNVNTPGQGYLGGLGTAAEGGGGGGGSGGPGINSGNGGIGTQINITGTNLYYAGGGGGGHNPSGTSGGLGGGGSATFYVGNNATFYGGGGGGGGANWGNGGNGFSGIVIIKFKSIVNSAIPEGNPITHKTLNFAYDNNLLVYDFTNYNTEATWKAYAATIPNFTYSFNYWFAEGYDGLWYSGIVGFIQYNLPSSYNNLTVYFGNLNAVNSYVRLLINGVEKSRVTNIGTTTYSQQYIQGDILRVEEEGGIINANIIITLTNTNFITNTYTLNFPVPTIADINNNSNIVLRGAYDISLSSMNSSIIPKSNQYIPKPTTFSTSNLSVRYNLLNPVLDPSGAQWTYNTSNTNVYHMGNVGIGTKSPEYSLDVNGSLNANTYYFNGVQIGRLSEGMVANVQHLTYTHMEVKNNTGWDAINDDLTTGFVISITPKSNLSKILVNLIAHIGLTNTNDGRWWGLKLYRKIGTAAWTELTGPNGTETGSAATTAGTPVWISNNIGTVTANYPYQIINLTGTYLDSPNTTSIVYYTAYWNQRIGDNPSRTSELWLNRAANQDDAYRPAPSSSWTIKEIWYG